MVTTIGGNGIVTRRSPRPFRETVSRVEQAARAMGAQLFGRVLITRPMPNSLGWPDSPLNC